ncbi:hypothetical protein B0H13DRAFT_1850208 [Mycena leptocephala]|nr:hypothetical protein B0H13DRAFT_1882368 [Mycena leptocephala]KAJ7940008.1 hypothetical protein B0H13DRAFT_1850208 [Mycena leptocephala]
MTARMWKKRKKPKRTHPRLSPNPLPEPLPEPAKVPRVRKLPARFDGMADERVNIPKGRYVHKLAAPVPVDVQMLEEEEEDVFGMVKGQNISFELKLTGIARLKVHLNQY